MMTGAAQRFWISALGVPPIARVVWWWARRARRTPEGSPRRTIDFAATGEILEVSPRVGWIARQLASRLIDEAKLVYLGATVAAAEIGPGDGVVAAVPPDVPVAAFLRAFLVALGKPSTVAIVRHRAADGPADRGTETSPLALLVVDPGLTGGELEAHLHRLTPRVKHGGFVFVLHSFRRDPANLDPLDAFLETHPEFELVHESYFAVLRRCDRAPRRKLRSLPVLDFAAVAAPDLEAPIPPELVEFTVDEACLCLNLDQCNLRCIMCWTTYEREGNRGRYAVVDLPRHRLLALLAAPELARTTLSIVGGGEPFLYPHLGDLLERGPTDTRRLMIMTNGTLLHDHPEFWEAAERAPITLTFSVDAATAGTYEQIRPPGKWDVLVGNIERFVALRAKNPRLRVQTSYVVLRQNLAEVGEFMRLNVEWGARYVHFHPAIRGAFPSEWLVDPFGEEFVRTMAEAAETARAHGIRLDRPQEIVPAEFVSGGQICPASPRSPEPPGSRVADASESSLPPGDPRRSCTLHSRAMTINHLGDVFVCDTAFRVGYRCGNVFRDGIQGAWLSPAWVSLRQAHRAAQPHRHPLCRNCLMVPSSSARS